MMKVNNDVKIYAFADEASPFIDDQIKAMKENAVDGLEIRNVDNVNIAEISDSKASEIKRKLDDANLKVWSIGSPIGKIDIEKDDFLLHIEKFKRTIEIAHILEAENIRLFSFFTPEETRDNYRDKVIEYLGMFVDIARGCGITICHENEKGIYGDTPERCFEIHKEFPEVKAIFDPANYIQCGVDTLKGWSILKPYVKYLHIKDALKDGSVVPAGKGIGNLKFILDDFRNCVGNSITIEPHLSVFEGLHTLEKEDTKSTVGEIYRYPSNELAFKAAVSALRELL